MKNEINEIKMTRNQEEIISNSGVQTEVRREKRKGMPPLVAILFILILGALSWYGYRQYTHTEQYRMLKNSSNTDLLLKQVGRLMILPDEVPATFEVEDPALLISQQPFFVGAQKGDRLLVYPQSGKAILYSPTRNIIVNAGVIDVGSQTAGTKQATQADQKTQPETSQQADTTTTPDTTKQEN